MKKGACENAIYTTCPSEAIVIVDAVREMNLLVSWGAGGGRPVLSGRQHVMIASSDISNSFTNESH